MLLQNVPFLDTFSKWLKYFLDISLIRLFCDVGGGDCPILQMEEEA